MKKIVSLIFISMGVVGSVGCMKTKVSVSKKQETSVVEQGLKMKIVYEEEQNKEIENINVEYGALVKMKTAIFDQNDTYVKDVKTTWKLVNQDNKSEFSKLLSVSEDEISSKCTFFASHIGSVQIQATFVPEYNEPYVNLTQTTAITGTIKVIDKDMSEFFISIYSGNNQQGIVGNILTNPLKVIVKDPSGKGIDDIKVKFSVSSDDDAQIIGDPVVSTSQGGYAQTQIKLGTIAKEYYIKANIEGNDDKKVYFKMTAIPDSPSKLEFIKEPNKAIVGYPFYIQPQVVIKDKFNNTITDAQGYIELTLYQGSGMLSGTLTRSLNEGKATFFGISYNIAEPIKLKASWSVDSQIYAISSEFNVNPQPEGACVVNDSSFITEDGGCKDLQTGLVWSKKSTTQLNWYDAIWDSKLLGNAPTDAGDYKRTNDYDPNEGCANFCDNSVTNYCHELEEGGFTDWRMPTHQELLDLYTHGGGSHLKNAASEGILSSTSSSSDLQKVKVVNIITGASAEILKSTDLRYVFCVRGARSNADRLVFERGLDSIIINQPTTIWVRIADSLGNYAQVEGVNISLSAATGNISGNPQGLTTDNKGRAAIYGWSIDTLGTNTITVSAIDYTPATNNLTVLLSNAFPHKCNGSNQEFGTADGGCKDIVSGLVWSGMAPTSLTWYEAIWDAYSPENNTPPKPSDGTRTNDYDKDQHKGYPDLSTRNYCHDEVEDGGYTDWRMPTENEWWFVNQSGRAPVYFTIHYGDKYWTSTSSSTGYPENAQIVMLGWGGTRQVKTSKVSVVCVRKDK